jgi:hypothetical protein
MRRAPRLRKCSSLDEDRRDALPSVFGLHRETVHAAPPAIPGSDERADQPFIVLGNEETAIILLEESVDRRTVVRDARTHRVAA